MICPAGLLFFLLGMPADGARASSQTPPARTLVVCDDNQGPATLDPHRQFTEKNHTLLQQIFEGLVRFDPEGRVTPALAESWERVDDKTMEFHLRENVLFHDGQPFDARSVRWSIERYLDPAVGFPARGYVDTIEGVDVLSPHRVRIRTRIPDGLLLNRLAGFMLMVPINGNGQAVLSDKPIGTGPFRFQRWDKGERIVLDANPGYWMKGYPKAKRLEFVFLPQDKQVQALLDGKVDILTSLPGTETLRVHTHPGTRVEKQNSFYTIATSLRTDRPPLNDERVRKALNYALDKDDLVRYDAMGNGRPLASLSMPGEFGHNARLKPYPYDVAKARALLAQAGFQGGLRLRALVKINAQRAARIMARQWEKVGVSLDNELVADADLVRKFKEGDFDMAIGDIPDPAAHSFFIQSIVIHSGSPFALSRNPDYDGLLERSAALVDLDAQRKAFEALDQYVYDQALSVFTYQRVKTYGLSKNVRFEPYVTAMPHFFSAGRDSGYAR